MKVSLPMVDWQLARRFWTSMVQGYRFECKDERLLGMWSGTSHSNNAVAERCQKDPGAAARN